MTKDKSSKTAKKPAVKPAAAPAAKPAAPKTFAARAVVSADKGQNPPSDGN